MTESGYMCRECGEMSYYKKYYCTSSREGCSIVSPDIHGVFIEGSIEDADDESDYSDWEESDNDFECSECGSTDLLCLDDLAPEQITNLLNMEDNDERIDAAEKMLKGEYKPARKRKGLIGERKYQG